MHTMINVHGKHIFCQLSEMNKDYYVAYHRETDKGYIVDKEFNAVDNEKAKELLVANRAIIRTLAKIKKIFSIKRKSRNVWKLMEKRIMEIDDNDLIHGLVDSDYFMFMVLS